jgi:methyltransferase
MVSEWIFAAILAALAVQRLAEVRLSKHNEARLLAQGGREHAAGHFRVMQALHMLWFAAALFEVLVLRRPFIPVLFAAALALLLAGQFLRYAAIRTLGPRWTVRVLTLPGAAPVDKGIYRYIRHPNYVGVILELAAVPLLHTAYLTAILFSAANAILMVVRIRAEERALQESSAYDDVFRKRPRFIPKV